MTASLYEHRYQALRRLLIQARRARGLNQTTVAACLGVGQSYVSKMERGEAFIDVLVFLDWCRCLALDPGVVLASVPSPSNGPAAEGD